MTFSPALPRTFQSPFPTSGAAAFSPPSIAGLKVWYDLSDITTLFQDSAGTTPVAADGDVIGRMNDKSGIGNNAAQGTTANKPLYKTNIQNGLPALKTDLVNDYMVATLAVSVTNPFTIFVCYNSYGDTTTNNYNRILDTVSHSSSRVLFDVGRWKSANDELQVYSGLGNISSLGVSLNNDHITVGVFGSSGLSRVDGVQKDSGDSGSNTLGSFRMFQAQDSAGVTRFGLYLYEFIVYQGALSAGQIVQVETYLNSKWVVY